MMRMNRASPAPPSCGRAEISAGKIASNAGAPLVFHSITHRVGYCDCAPQLWDDDAVGDDVLTQNDELVADQTAPHDVSYPWGVVGCVGLHDPDSRDDQPAGVVGFEVHNAVEIVDPRHCALVHGEVGGSGYPGGAVPCFGGTGELVDEVFRYRHRPLLFKRWCSVGSTPTVVLRLVTWGLS